jgi:hypothetical protein
MLADFDPDNPGLEYYTGEADHSEYWMYGVNGRLLSKEGFAPLNPKALYWLEGPQKAFVNYKHKRIQLYKGPTLGRYEGTKIMAVADCVGDWREELITSIPGELRVYISTFPAKDRHVALMQDDIYRMDVAMVSMGYLYPPQLSYYFKSD